MRFYKRSQSQCVRQLWACTCADICLRRLSAISLTTNNAFSLVGASPLKQNPGDAAVENYYYYLIPKINAQRRKDRHRDEGRENERDCPC